MIPRLCKPSDQQSFFLLGGRGTGKSTLLAQLPFLQDCKLQLNLLKPSQQEQYSIRPELLEQRASLLPEGAWVVIDEVQKIPKLLDVVHSLIEEKQLKFALTGSSSRKLKRGGANLLAGRAVNFSLFPFTAREMGASFDLDSALRWGTLPKVVSLADTKEKVRFLRTYVHVYLKEEILVEQLVRNLDPFRLFLPLAAQMDGEIINYSNISKDTGVDHKTVQNYYQILADTNLGSFLEPFGTSVRKVQIQSPKFYSFDLGVKSSLQSRLTLPLVPGSSEYGAAFESWFINECFRLNSYLERDMSFSYLRTKDDAEIDLIVRRPNGSLALVEIKAAQSIDERHVRWLNHFSADFPKADLICACRVPVAQKIGRIHVLPWDEALVEIGF